MLTRMLRSCLIIEVYIYSLLPYHLLSPDSLADGLDAPPQLRHITTRAVAATEAQQLPRELLGDTAARGFEHRLGAPKQRQFHAMSALSEALSGPFHLLS